MALHSQGILRGNSIVALIAAATLVAAWLSATAALAASPPAEESGFVPLTGYDAREHWLAYGMEKAKDSWPSNWELVDGALHCKGGGADLKTREQYGDFDL